METPQPISEVFNIDCMEYMKTLPDKFFDLAIVDPPYGIGDFNNKPTVKKRYNKAESIAWNNATPKKEYFNELKRVAKNHIIFGFQFYIEHLWGDLKGVIIHHFGSTGGFGSDADLAITNLQNRVTNFKYRWQGFIKDGKEGTDFNRIHPCEKPLSLYKWLLKNYAKPGDKIFDSHLGSQSSRIAAYDMGFDFYGCELDPDYFAAGCKRFEEHKLQLKLL